MNYYSLRVFACTLFLFPMLSTIPAHGAECSDKGVGHITGTIAASFVRSKKFDTFIWLQNRPARHNNANARQVIDQVEWKFVPRMLTIATGTEVEFRNSDKDIHNVYSPQVKKYGFADMLPGGIERWRFTTPGVYRQLCTIHPRMTSLIVVTSSPYQTTADKRGHFTLPNVPAGKWMLRVANEKLTDAQLTKGTPITISPCKETKLSLTYKAEELRPL